MNETSPYWIDVQPSRRNPSLYEITLYRVLAETPESEIVASIELSAADLENVDTSTLVEDTRTQPETMTDRLIAFLLTVEPEPEARVRLLVQILARASNYLADAS